MLIVAAEYARQRRKDILKKASEEADRERILEQARMEREVSPRFRCEAAI